jgi:threonine aldolase
MVKAMCEAEVGDDVYGDDPTMKKLEEKSAGVLGMEDAVFVPSGTFGNQLAILTHTGRGQEVIIPEDNHIVMHEAGASAVIAGVQLRFVHEAKGKISREELEFLWREPDIHHPDTGLICMENAHSCGSVVPMENMEAVSGFARERNLPVHLDGARIFNAAAALGVKAVEIAAFFDSVMFCFSKGLCAPVGSVLAGSASFIEKARKNRKLMGGGMRQAGYLAAPCLVALEKMVDRLEEDHRNASYLALKLEETGHFEVMKDRLDINMVFAKPLNTNPGTGFNDSSFYSFLAVNNIKINPVYLGEYRFVTHFYIDRKKIDILIQAINDYFKGGF